MTESGDAPRPRARLRDSTWFAFGATTSALVLLASGGTAFLVQFGADEGQAPIRALHAPSPSTLPHTSESIVTVDRVVGSFHTIPTSASSSTAQLSLAQLLSPPVVNAPVPTPPAPPADPQAGLLPEPPPIPDPGPQPTPPTVHPPVLPLPNPLPLPLPIPLPVLPTLPPIPLPHL